MAKVVLATAEPRLAVWIGTHPNTHILAEPLYNDVIGKMSLAGVFAPYEGEKITVRIRHVGLHPLHGWGYIENGDVLITRLQENDAMAAGGKDIE